MITACPQVLAPLAYGMGAWDLGSFLMNAASQVKVWGGGLIILVGLVLVVIAVVLGGKAVAAKANGNGQPAPWVWVLLLLILGGAMVAGGFAFFLDIAQGGKTTIEQLGTGTWLWL